MPSSSLTPRQKFEQGDYSGAMDDAYAAARGTSDAERALRLVYRAFGRRLPVWSSRLDTGLRLGERAVRATRRVSESLGDQAHGLRISLLAFAGAKDQSQRDERRAADICVMLWERAGQIAGSVHEWSGPGHPMKVAALRLGFKSSRSLKSHLEYMTKVRRVEDPLWEFRSGGTARTPDGKFRERDLVAFEAAMRHGPAVARAVAEGAAQRATQVASRVARKLPLSALERVYRTRANR